jgi:hypothetical protein
MKRNMIKVLWVKILIYTVSTYRSKTVTWNPYPDVRRANPRALRTEHADENTQTATKTVDEQ